jgi:hypothetical protein
MGRRLVVAAVAVVVALGALVACGGEEEGGTATGATSTVTAAVPLTTDPCALRAQLAQSLQLLRGAVASGSSADAVTAIAGVEATLARIDADAQTLPVGRREEILGVTSGLGSLVAGVQTAQGPEQTMERARVASSTMTATIQAVGRVYDCPPIPGVDDGSPEGSPTGP